MRIVKAMIRTVAHRFGVELSRYQREGRVFQQCVNQLQGAVERIFDVGATRLTSLGSSVSHYQSCNISHAVSVSLAASASSHLRNAATAGRLAESSLLTR
jgi:hypothetical protein